MFPMLVRPGNDEERIRALHELRFSYGHRASVLDHVAKVAIEHFKVPIALVSLVDETEQCFVGCHGLSVAGTPRSHAFCR